MEGTLRIQVIHVSGTRMISQGADGLSRGLIKEGSISGEYIMSFLPLHLSALKCSDKLLEWIKSWWEKGNEVPLTPEYWFKKGKGITGQFTK